MHLSTSSFFFCCWLVFGVVAAFRNTTTSTCNTLSSVLSNDIFFPDTDTYNTSISSYPFIQLRLHPTCILRPKTAQDVSTALNILRESGTRFAVRGGGHNANVGFNNIEDGVTMDMRSMNAVNVDVGQKVAKVGAGAIWQNVYDSVEPYSLTVLGGRIGVVGVAGFTTGGGISFYSPERGWACDAVVNFQVVLASGDIVDVNATSRPDLFAGLKGGQNNFGIVTRFDLDAFPVGKMWGGRITFAPEADTALVSAFTDFKNPDKFDPYAAGWVTFRYNGSAKLLTPTTILWYTKPELKPGALGNMTEVVGPQLMNGMQTAYPSEFARNASMVVKNSNSRTIWATTTFRITPTIVNRIYSLWKSTIPKVCETYGNATSELTFQSLSPPPRNGSQPNSMGFASTSSPEKDLVFLQIIFYFQDERDTEGLNNELKDFISMFDALAEEEGVKERFVYLNFAAWFQDPLEGYGDEEVGRLRRVARKYDPEGLFQRQLVGGFKVFGGEGAGWNASRTSS